MKHTPGPWKVVRAQIRRLEIRSDDKDDTDIALIKFWPNESKANAQLIASAPDLLEACIEASMYLNASDFGPVCREILERLQKAIAKAEGNIT